MAADRSERRIKNNRIRRRQELRRHFMISIFTFILILSFSTLFFSLRTKAQGQNELLYKYYKSVVVEEGDTLWHYACQYAQEEYYDSQEDYIQEVININSLSEDHITAGQYLILPYYSPEFIG